MRLFLIIAVVLFALWLPHPPSPGVAVGADRPTAGPALLADQAILPAVPGRYGNLQHVRTPLPPRTIALTFDDGPGPDLLPQVLDILDAHEIKATFFMVGSYARQRPDLVREVVRRGHNVASHSWSHPTRLRDWSPDRQRFEVRRGFAALEAALAEAPPEQRARLEPMFRFPGLGEGAYMAGWLGDRGIQVISAEAGTDDWRGYPAAVITRRTLAAMDSSQGGGPDPARDPAADDPGPAGTAGCAAGTGLPVRADHRRTGRPPPGAGGGRSGSDPRVRCD
jgi:peptidoglycan/xylan/chitin deacetylase (PgdA/CDA1 family)